MSRNRKERKVNLNATKKKPFYLVPRDMELRRQENVVPVSVRFSRAKRAAKRNVYNFFLVHSDNLESVLGEKENV